MGLEADWTDCTQRLLTRLGIEKNSWEGIISARDVEYILQMTQDRIRGGCSPTRETLKVYYYAKSMFCRDAAALAGDDFVRRRFERRVEAAEEAYRSFLTV